MRAFGGARPALAQMLDVELDLAKGVVVEATLTHETAYGVCECLGDGSITIAGEGSVPSRVLAPPPSLTRRLA